MSLNRVVLIGNLTREPELKYTPAGVPVAQMGIAVNRISKNEQGDYEVDFFNITAWRRTAEFAQNYLTKGSRIAVDGRLQTRSWVDQASGQKRTSFEIIAENIQSLDRRGEGPTGSESDMSAPPAAAPAPTAARQSAPPRAAAPSRNAPPPDDALDEADPFADE
jgi:single-strand DNA-binding protein